MVDTAIREAARGDIDLNAYSKTVPHGAPTRKDKFFPVGSHDDPTAWQVCDSVQALLRDLVFKAQYYGFDCKLNKIICELN